MMKNPKILVGQSLICPPLKCVLMITMEAFAKTQNGHPIDSPESHKVN